MMLPKTVLRILSLVTCIAVTALHLFFFFPKAYVPLPNSRWLTIWIPWWWCGGFCCRSPPRCVWSEEAPRASRSPAAGPSASCSWNHHTHTAVVQRKTKCAPHEIQSYAFHHFGGRLAEGKRISYIVPPRRVLCCMHYHTGAFSMQVRIVIWTSRVVWLLSGQSAHALNEVHACT